MTFEALRHYTLIASAALAFVVAGTTAVILALTPIDRPTPRLTTPFTDTLQITSPYLVQTPASFEQGLYGIAGTGK